MNLRNAIEAYANAVSSRDHYSIVGDGKREAESIARLVACSQSLDALLAVAEAAIAIVEQQVAVEHRVPVDVVMGFGRLWDAFMSAHKAAKEANQS